jgi:tetratricopeptide (TPR) repeat protein
MRATVLRDAALRKHAGRFVWLSIDTENEKNAAFLETYPWKAVPTFEVLDAKTSKIAYQFIGAVDTPELIRRFDEAERACKRADPQDVASPASEDAQVLALSMAGKYEECAQRALALCPQLPPAGVKANVAATGLDCALSAPEDAAWRPTALTQLEAVAREAVRYEGLLDDDRSGLYGTLVDARDRQHDEAGGKAEAAAWLDWLDVQAKTAPSPEARAALDGYRVSAAQRAGAPERVLAAVQSSERELPNDYNPPARLAIILREMGRYDDALAASDRALRMVYGPRKLTLLDARATILDKKGDANGAKAVLREALDYAGTLPASQRPKRMIASIEKRLGQVEPAN